MRKVVRSAILSAVLAGGLALPVAAQTQPPPAADAAAKPAKKICRSEETTGSHLGGERRCMTAAEWAAEDRAQHAANRERNQELSKSPRL